LNGRENGENKKWNSGDSKKKEEEERLRKEREEELERRRKEEESQNVVGYATDQWRKRLEVCVHAALAA